MGRKSYDELVMQLNMASSPEVVVSFLLEISNMVKTKADEVVASYFSMPLCIEGFKLLVNSLFGTNFDSVPIAPGESWHPDVLKICIHHPEELCINGGIVPDVSSCLEELKLTDNGSGDSTSIGIWEEK
ncbi:hypothetical protein F3Y22_tig00009024pilonHSYRG00023 [Hibiscus syriacus]|uniref:Uncharacterized protein n=1 Tax=Hibiscus syriacus TaxID=106335 RepID=A0A6A3C8U9_HIBSY|nr:hypothetical protein F3Y22_tig00009024pilonHSYRG00023 [Hibiscus syriacus]